MAENKESSVIEGFLAELISLVKEMKARLDSLEETNKAQKEIIEELREQMKSAQRNESVALDPKVVESDDVMVEDAEIPEDSSAEPEGEKDDNAQAMPEAQPNGQTDGQPTDETKSQQSNGEKKPQQQPNGQTGQSNNETKSQQPNGQTNGQSSDETKSQQPNNEKKSPKKQQQQNLKLVDKGNKQFVATDEFTEEQLAGMHRSMQADRARTKQLFNHVTSPYAMRGSAGETAAMAAGALMGFVLGRSMYKVSRVGHLRQDWKLRREVLRQERGAYGQGGYSRLDTLRQGFSNAASAFTQGFSRGRRTDIDMNMSAQPAQRQQEVPAPPAQPEQHQQPAEKAEKVVVKADNNVFDDEDTIDADFSAEVVG